MKNKTLVGLLFTLIIILAVFLRVYKLETIPPGLFGDEIDVGYQAYSLLETGRDLTGRFLPFYLKSLTEFRTPLYIYSAVPFVAIFGLNEWGVRMPAVFWGISSIVGIFFLGRKFFNSRTGLIAMFLMSLSPWHLQYSRASFEVTMLLDFLIWGAYCFILGLEKNRYLFLSIIFLTSSIYIYSTAVVFAPLLGLILVLINWQKTWRISKKNLVLLLITALVFLIPLGMSMITGEAKERFSSISIFQDKVLIDKLNLARKGEEFFTPEGEIQKTDVQTELLFHNKITVFTQVFLTNYFRALNPSFLFAEGDINFRHAIHEMGEMHYFELILLVLGVFCLLKVDKKKSLLIAGWLLIAPIPASLTYDGGFHGTRLFLMLPPLTLITALGGNWIIENWKKLSTKILATIVIFIFMLNMIFYFHRYYLHYAPESWRWWHIGYKEAMQYIKTQENNYALVGFNNTYEPALIRFLFWSQMDPALFQKKYPQTLEVGEPIPGFKGFKLGDKYFFGTTAGKSINETLPEDMIYMVSARDEVPGDWNWAKTPPAGIKVLKTVYNPLGEPIFYVITKD